MVDCENCWYYSYDEETDEYFCRQYLDEDEVARFLFGEHPRCPYFQSSSEYDVAKKQ